jgi:hypothetical protein
MSEYNKKTWKPHESDVRETYEVFQKEFLNLIDKVDNYWYAKKAPNQSSRLIQTVMKKYFTKKKFWQHKEGK